MKPTIRTILKYTGGKVGLADAIADAMPTPDVYGRYFEPFFGGGSVFFAMAALHKLVPVDVPTPAAVAKPAESVVPQLGLFGTSAPVLQTARRSTQAVLGDASAMSSSTWQAVRTFPHEVADLLAEMPVTEPEYRAVYYEIRERFRATPPNGLARYAADFIWLNKACFNGLVRTNRKGEFNAACGDYPRGVHLPSAERILQVAEWLRLAEPVACQDFLDTLSDVRSGDVVYCDPPYVPVDADQFGGFEEYGPLAFGPENHAKLLSRLRELAQAGANVYLSYGESAPIEGAVLVAQWAKRRTISRGARREAAECLYRFKS